MVRPEINVSKDLQDFGLVTEDKVEQFEHLLAEAIDGLRIAMISPLLLPLDDTCEFDGVMFGVVHALEKFPCDSYFAGIAKHLSSMWAKSPRWCGILHARIINSSSSFTVFVQNFSHADSETRATEILILKKISSKERFRDRCYAGIETLMAGVNAIRNP